MRGDLSFLFFCFQVKFGNCVLMLLFLMVNQTIQKGTGWTPLIKNTIDFHKLFISVVNLLCMSIITFYAICSNQN